MFTTAFLHFSCGRWHCSILPGASGRSSHVFCDSFICASLLVSILVCFFFLFLFFFGSVWAALHLFFFLPVSCPLFLHQASGSPWSEVVFAILIFGFHSASMIDVSRPIRVASDCVPFLLATNFKLLHVGNHGSWNIMVARPVS